MNVFRVKMPVDFIFECECLGTVFGLKINPTRAGLLPKWIIELNIARFWLPEGETEPIKCADLYPVTLFIKFNLNIFDKPSSFFNPKWCMLVN